jgi:tetratricopeptide (TPR) repeat protein
MQKAFPPAGRDRSYTRGVRFARAMGGCLAIGAVLLGIVLVRARSAPVPAGASRDASTTPLSSNDLEALIEFAHAMRALHDASLSRAFRELAHATQRDPDFVAAALPLMLERAEQLSVLRARFVRASRLRARLGARERALLDIAEPGVVNDTPDYAEIARRAEAAAARYPDDPWMAYVLARALDDVGRTDDALAQGARALALDPGFALAHLARAATFRRAGDTIEAEAEYDTCIETTPVAATCLRFRSDLYDERGECGKAASLARSAAAIDPDDALEAAQETKPRLSAVRCPPRP